MKALENRPFKLRRPTLRFFCALCRTERQISKTSKLSRFQVFQIALISSILLLVLFPLWGVKSLITVPIIWGLYEGIHKMLFRKEIPCPYCGFDATWYKRDVKLARKAVKEFWEEQAPPAEASAQPSDLAQ